MRRRQFLRVALACSLAGCAYTGPRLNFYNWSNFLAEDTLSNFEASTGIRVHLEQFSSADIMYAKLKIGVTGYDLVVSPDYLVARLIKQNLVQPITDVSLEGYLPHLLYRPWDPEQRYCLPYLWGTTGIAYNQKHVTGRPDSWALLWNPALEKRITILDEKRDAIGMALFRLRFSGKALTPINSTGPSRRCLSKSPWCVNTHPTSSTT